MTEIIKRFSEEQELAIQGIVEFLESLDFIRLEEQLAMMTADIYIHQINRIFNTTEELNRAAIARFRRQHPN